MHKQISRKIFLFSVFFNVLLIGAVFNLEAMKTNNGLMPVYSDSPGYQDNAHLLFQDFHQVRFPYLSDIFFIPNLVAFSIGDMLIWIGVIGLFVFGIWSIIEKIKERGKRGDMGRRKHK